MAVICNHRPVTEIACSAKKYLKYLFLSARKTVIFIPSPYYQKGKVFSIQSVLKKSLTFQVLMLYKPRVQSSFVMPDLIRNPERLTYQKDTGFRLSPE